MIFKERKKLLFFFSNDMHTISHNLLNLTDNNIVHIIIKINEGVDLLSLKLDKYIQTIKYGILLITYTKK